MRRVTVFITAFFVCGMLLFSCGADIRITAAVTVMFALYSIFTRRCAMGAVLLAFIMLTAGGARMYFAAEHRSRISHRYDEAVLTTDLLVKDFPEEGKFTASFKAGKEKLNVRVKADKCPKLVPGDIINAKITLSAPLYMKSSFDYSAYLSGKNIFLTGEAEKVRLTEKKCGKFYGAACAVRCFISDVSEKYFKGDVRGLFSAMLIGDKRFISEKLNTSLRNAGLSHIAVVSGMHLSVLISVLMFFIYSVLGKSRKACLISIAAVIFFTFVTGADASVVRACIMCVTYQAAAMLYREKDPLTSLSASVFIMTLINPFVLMNTGFVFSVLSVLGILLYNDGIYKRLAFIPPAAAGALSVTLSAQLTVLPASVYLFGGAALYSPVANVFVSVFATLLICGGFLLALFSCVPLVSDGLALLCKGFSMAVIGIVDMFSSLPGAYINIGKVSLFFLVVYYGALCLLRLYPWLRRYIVTLAVLACFSAAVLFSVFNSDSYLYIDFLPYTEGDCTVMRFPDNRYACIDCKNAYDMEAYAENNNITQFEYAVQSSTQWDEMLRLAAAGKIKKLIMPMSSYNGTTAEYLESLYDKTGMETLWLEKNEAVDFCGGVLFYEDVCAEYKESAVVRLEYKGKSFVTMQSATAKGIETLYDNGAVLYADFVKPPGIVTDTSKKLSQIINGKIAEKDKEIIFKP